MRHYPRAWLPNSTPVVMVGSTCHLANGHQRTNCADLAGRPTQLVQVKVYLAVQWCLSPPCFPGGEPK